MQELNSLGYCETSDSEAEAPSSLSTIASSAAQSEATCCHVRQGTIPQELCDMIIDLASDDSDCSTIVSCALVSRRWVSRARSHALRSVVFKHPDNITTFLAIIGSPFPGVGSIPRFVRDLTMRQRPDAKKSQIVCRDERMAELLPRLVSLDTLRIEHMRWGKAFGVVPAVVDATIDVARRISQLHLHDVAFYYISDMLRLLSSSPQWSILCFTSSKLKFLCHFDRETRPIHQEVHVDTFGGDLFGYAHFCFSMRAAHFVNWPFSVSIREVCFVDETWQWFWPCKTGMLKEEQFEDYLGNMCGSNYHLNAFITQESPFKRKQAAPSGHARFPNLVVQTFRITGIDLLHPPTQFTQLFIECLWCKFIFAERIYITLPTTDPSEGVDEQQLADCSELDSALMRSMEEEPRPEVVFETSSPAEHLAGWSHIVSECLPSLVASEARVGIVCKDGEGCVVAEHWWA